MVRIGIIGTGGMAHAHAQCFSAIRGSKITGCCDLDEKRAKAFAKKFKIPGVFTDYGKMLDSGELDAVSNVTPDSLHKPIALACLKRKIPILSEKPLATSLADARTMARAAKRARVANLVNFSYRNSSGLRAAAQLVAKGGIGRVMHVEASYLQSWLSSPYWGDWRKHDRWLWRLSTRHGSDGVLGDVGCHVFDMATFLAGDIDEIYCRLKTFKKDVPGERIGSYRLDANDSIMANVVFKNGALGTIHSSRWATGHKNSQRVRVYGDKGAVEIDLDRSFAAYRVCKGPDVRKVAWKTVKCKPSPAYLYEQFVKAVKTGVNDPSDFANGAKVQAYLHYCRESDKAGKPVKVRF